MTKGLDGCLFVFGNDEWAKLVERLRSLPLTNVNARKFTRFLMSGAVNCETDRQGRILIPSNLREYAGITKDAVLAGNGSRVEIWSAERWTVEQEFEENVEEIAAGLDGLGIIL